MDGAPASASIAAVGLVKNEADIIAATLLHLHRIGIRRFVIADNGSTDGTPDIVQQFAAEHPDVTLVSLHDPVPQYVQWRKNTAMAHFAHHFFGVDYIYPFDADEFLVPPSALRDVEARNNGPPASDQIADLLSHAAGRDYIDLRWVTCIGQGPGEGLSICGKSSHLRKLIVRWREDLVIEQGNHAMVPRPRRWWAPMPRQPRGASTPWRVLHVPVRSAAQLRAKIIRSAAANRSNPENWGMQSRSLNEAYLRQGDVVFDTLFDLVASPRSDRKDLERFGRRFGIDPRSLCYFQDFFRPRAPIAFRLPLSAGAGMSDGSKSA